MLRRITKKRALAALGVVAALVIASAAFAYFTSSGSGTGTASVGSSSAFTITTDSATGGPLLPGSGSENIAYHVTNGSSGTQNLSATSVSVSQDSNGDVVHNGTSVTGCKSSWFSASNNHPTYGPLAGSATVDGSVDVTMPNDTTDNQDACQSASPEVTISAS